MDDRQCKRKRRTTSRTTETSCTNEGLSSTVSSSSETTTTMNSVPSDVLLHVLSFLPVKDGNRAMCCSRRFAYLTDHFRATMDPQMVLSSDYTLSMMKDDDAAAVDEVGGRGSSHEKKNKEVTTTPRQVLLHGLKGLSAAPNVAFVFYTEPSAAEGGGGARSQSQAASPSGGAGWRRVVEDVLPPTTTVLAAKSDLNIQTSGATPTSGPESESTFSVMMGCFPQAKFVPFALCGETLTMHHGNHHDDAGVGGATPLSPFCDLSGGGGMGPSHHQGAAGVPPGIQMPYVPPRPEELVMQKLIQAQPHHTFNPRHYWKVIVLYVAGEHGIPGDVAPGLVRDLQRHLPETLIVGGVCGAADVRDQVELTHGGGGGLSFDQGVGGYFGRGSAAISGCHPKDSVTGRWRTVTKHLTSGVCGIAVGGCFPGESVVSRGVRSIITGNVAGKGRPSPWRVVEAEATAFHRCPVSLHVVKSVRNTLTGQVMNASEFLTNYSEVHYVGLKPNPSPMPADDDHVVVGGGRDPDAFLATSPNDGVADRYELVTPVYANDNGFYIRASDNPGRMDTLKDSTIDLFELEGEACMEDLDDALLGLRHHLHGYRILGSVMFSCQARGPVSDMLPGKMADATKFAEHFPSIPCAGFYACGEIGPEARVKVRECSGTGEGVFTRGAASLQGFTAVFLVFSVPIREEKELRLCLDDSEGQLARHMAQRMAAATWR